jgi:single-stranded-DNA-specific exonuclease
LDKKWNILPVDQKAAAALKESLKINDIICSILTQRQMLNFDDAKNYFRPSLKNLHSPWLMKDMRKAVERIKTAFENNERILVFGDYDVDGTTAVASFYQFLTSLYNKQHTDFYIPNRYKEGYGLSKKGIDYAFETKVSLMVCLDCGIKSVDLIDYAKKLHIDVIICDHHLPDNKIPDAVAILNPKQNDCNYPYKDLCGCGIGFKFMAALAEAFSIDEIQFHQYLDLVAIAIAADIVPMTGENRILTYYGMQKINSTPSLGIKTLMDLSGLKSQLTITNVVFAIAPRINAAGRMDDARKAVKLFIETDQEKALELANELHTDNSDRKEVDSTITKEALEIINSDEDFKNKKSSVLYREHWLKGVVGIVASRLIERHYRPTIVLTKSGDLATGSARSIKGFNLYEAIYECKEHLVTFGGHYAAAGLSLLPENIEAFAKQFDEVVAKNVSDDMLVPEITIDTPIRFSSIQYPFFNILRQMEPFGPENMNPIFVAEKLTDTGYSKIVKDEHIRFVLRQDNITLNGIGFYMKDKFDLLLQKKPIDVAFTIEENEYQGNKTLQLKVVDFRISE